MNGRNAAHWIREPDNPITRIGSAIKRRENGCRYRNRFRGFLLLRPAQHQRHAPRQSGILHRSQRTRISGRSAARSIQEPGNPTTKTGFVIRLLDNGYPFLDPRRALVVMSPQHVTCEDVVLGLFLSAGTSWRVLRSLMRLHNRKRECERSITILGEAGEGTL